MSKGLEGRIFSISVLPNTATQLVKAIYTQNELSKKDAYDMAGYLDKRYKMSDYVPTNPGETINEREDNG